MKKQSENTFTLLCQKQVEALTQVVKETLGFTKPKTFSTADLWNIQRRVRTMLQRRHLA
jgi:hypothetical protein